MRCAIVLAPEAVEDLGRLKANVRAAVRDATETHLRHTSASSRKTSGVNIGWSMIPRSCGALKGRGKAFGRDVG